MQQPAAVTSDDIVLDLDVQGGAPVIRGTRVTVESVAYYWRDREDNADVRRAFPQLTEQQVAAAITYYQAHRGVIDAWLSGADAAD